MRSRLISLVDYAHIKIFQQPMSSEMRKFLGNLSWSFTSGFIVLPTLMIVTTLAGRAMGPSEFGKYSLVLVISQFLVAAEFFGLDTTTVKYLAKAKDKAEKSSIISSNFRFITGVALLIALSTIALYPMLIRLTPEYASIILVATIFSFLTSVKLSQDLVIRGLEEFRLQAKIKILEVIVVVGLFSWIFYVSQNTPKRYTDLIFILSLGLIAASMAYWQQIKHFIQKFDFKTIKKQVIESKLYFISALFGTIFLSADRIFIGHFIDIQTLGIYSAYYLATFMVIAQISQLISNVFLPASARTKNKSFASKINRLFIYGFVPLSIASGLIGYLIMLIFGNEFTLNPWYLAGFSLLSILYFFQTLYNTIILDSKISQYRKNLIEVSLINLAGASFLLVLGVYGRISIASVLIVWIITFATVLGVQSRFVRRMY